METERLAATAGLAVMAICLGLPPASLSAATLRTDDSCLMACGPVPAPPDQDEARPRPPAATPPLGPAGPAFDAPLDLPGGGFLTGPGGAEPVWDGLPDPVPAMPDAPR
ncbi:hypothetical protein [Mangrovicoccus algicola]|uniref:Uncharacterized protein n=1 Tax=Mangrovicoccus algicola TaxID=2771008 RepID=A0A8J6YXD7_9RHOB|nr:hypothetical protein [Mangrovicoccus algicola]MBE3639427.1 hypothetical protein [Mangrovicoccus algicola]